MYMYRDIIHMWIYMYIYVFVINQSRRRSPTCQHNNA